MSRQSRISATELTFLEAVHPIMFGAAWKENRFDVRRASRRQIDMMLSDIAEWGRGLSDAQRREVDRLLEEAGAPNLSAMMKTELRKVIAILSRGKLNTDDEWRTLNAVVSDVDSDLLDDKARTKAQQMLLEFELKSRVGAL